MASLIKNLNLKHQLMLVFLVFSLIPSLFVSLLVFQQTDQLILNAKTEIEEQNRSKFEGLAYQIGLQVTDWVKEKIDDVTAFSLQDSIREGMTLISQNNYSMGINTLQPTLDVLISLNTDYTEIIIVDKNGTIITSALDATRTQEKTTGNVSTSDYFKGALYNKGTSINSDKTFYSSLYYLSDHQTYGMTVSHVIRDINGNIAGIIVLHIDPKIFWNFFNKRDSSGFIITDYYSQLGIPESGDIYLVDSSNMALTFSRFYQNDSTFILNTDVADELSQNLVLQKGRNAGESNGFALDYRKIPIYGFYLSLDSPIDPGDSRSDWFVETKEIDLPYVIIIEVDESELIEPINQLYEIRNTAIILIFVTTMILSLLTIKGSKKSNILKRRTNFAVVQEIIEFIEDNERVFKTDFEKIGFNVRSVEDWMQIILYIQSQPKIRQIKKGRISIYEYHENGGGSKNITEEKFNPKSNKQQRIMDIFSYIEKHEQVFKTDFEKIGLNTRSVEDWMQIISFIQNSPKVNEIKKSRFTIYEFGLKRENI